MKKSLILIGLLVSLSAFGAVPLSAPPSPLYVTNRSAAALRAALNVGTNGSPINATVLTNVSALGLQLGTLQAGSSGADDTELLGAVSQGATVFGPAGGFAWINPKSITATNLVISAGGKSCETNAIIEIFQSSSYPTNSFFLNAYSAAPLAPLYSNVITLPYPKAKMNVPLPSIPIAADQFAFVVIAGPTTNTGAFYLAAWINDAGNTNNPRYNTFYCDASGRIKAWQTTPPAYSEVASPACRFEGFISASSGVTAASDLTVSTAVSQLAGTNAQSQLDELGTNMVRRLFVFDGDSLSSPDGGGLDWAHRWLTNYPYFAQARRISVGTSGYRSEWVLTNYTALVHPYARTRASDELFYSARVGINDITYGTNLVDTMNNVSNLWSAATNDGFRVIAWTLTPVGYYEDARNNNRLAYNNWVRTNYMSWNAILMQPDIWFPDGNDTNYFYDQVHPTTNAMIELCRQFDATLRGNMDLTISSVTNTTIDVRNPAGKTVTIANALINGTFTGDGSGLTAVHATTADSATQDGAGHTIATYFQPLSAVSNYSIVAGTGVTVSNYVSGTNITVTVSSTASGGLYPAIVSGFLTANLNQNASNYISLGGGGRQNAEPGGLWRAPRAGYFTNFQVTVLAAKLTGTNIVWLVRTNTANSGSLVSSALWCSLQGPNQTTNNTAAACPVGAGDWVHMCLVANSAIASSEYYWTVEFVPTQ